MISSYRLDEVRHSREDKKHLATFVTLNGCDIGLDIQWELRGFRFTIFREHKRNVIAKTRWISFGTSQDEIYRILCDLVSKHFVDTGQLVEGEELPVYTRIELRIPVSHLHFHINAGTLQTLLEQEVIYY